MDYVRRDLDEIRTDLKSAVAALGHLPNKRDLETWRGQWLAIGIGIVALVIGGVVGGLALINHYAASGAPPTPAPAPMIVQVPYPAPAEAPRPIPKQ